MSAKSKARKVQDATGLSYMTALRLVRGELAFTPKAHDCIIQAALKDAHVTVPGPEISKPCTCPRCDPDD